VKNIPPGKAPALLNQPGKKLAKGKDFSLFYPAVSNEEKKFL
jgi:hypothetical protein